MNSGPGKIVRGQLMMRPQWIKVIIALVSVSFTLPAFATTGLDSLIIIYWLLFLVLTPIPLVLIIASFVMRARKPDVWHWILPGISVVTTAGFVIWGGSLINRPILEALNPWWSNDSAILTFVCLTLIVGNALYFAGSFGRGILVVAVVIVFLFVQRLGTAGKSFYYQHNPLIGKTYKIELLDNHNIQWEDKILSFDKVLLQQWCCTATLGAEVRPNSDGTYTVVVATINRDPRLPAMGDYRPKSKWEYRDFFQPSYVAKVLVKNAVLLDKGKVPDNMIFEAVQYGIVTRSRSQVKLWGWVAELAKLGADPDYIDEKSGDSPLSSVLKRADLALVRVLIQDAGADPNLILPDGNTALHRVVRRISPYTFMLTKSLLEYGADPSIRNAHGDTPLDIIEDYIVHAGLDPKKSNGVKAAGLLQEAMNGSQENGTKGSE